MTIRHHITMRTLVAGFLGLCFGILATVALQLSAAYEPPPFSPPVNEDAEFGIFLQMLAGADDPREAYLSFATRFDGTKYPSVHPNDVHELFHRIGRYFHDEYGTRAVLLCDFQYNWGCFHGFVAQALERNGEEVIAQAAVLCAERENYYFGKCVHGLGQGILFATGYDLAGVREGLRLCDSTLRQGRSTCYNGVLKEYNDRSAKPYDGSSGSESVERDTSDVFGLCDALDERYAFSCYYELPYFWWRHIFEEDFIAMGEACSTLTDETALERCVRGVARSIFGKTKYDPEVLPPLCQSYRDERESRWCFSEGLAILAGTFSEKGVEPVLICEAASAPWQRWCDGVLSEYPKR